MVFLEDAPDRLGLPALFAVYLLTAANSKLSGQTRVSLTSFVYRPLSYSCGKYLLSLNTVLTASEVAWNAWHQRTGEVD